MELDLESMSYESLDRGHRHVRSWSSSSFSASGSAVVGPEPAMTTVAVLSRSLVKKIQEVLGAARAAGALRETFLQLACYLERVLPIALEIQNNGSDTSAETSEILDAAGRDVECVRRLLAECSGKSAIYLLTRCESITRQIEEIVRNLGRSLGLLPLSAIRNDEDVKAVVDSVARDMQQACFEVKESDGRLRRLLQPDSSSTAEIESDPGLQTGLLLDIAQSVGIEDVHRNPSALKQQIDLLRNDLRGTSEIYDLHMMDLLGTLVDRWVEEKNQTPLPSNDTGLSPSSPPSSSSASLKRVEPVYESFVCPLTKQVMRDPVTLESGQTYERSAIERWFKECREHGRPPICPITGKELESTAVKPSIAFKNTIDEWVKRNENVRIDNAKILIAGKGNDQDILHSLKDLQLLCIKNKLNKQRVRATSLINVIVDCLSKSSEQIRCAALTTLRVLVEEDDDNKEAIRETDALRVCVKCFYREHPKEREEAVLLLFELSKSVSLCEKIGQVNGAILMLVGMTSSKSENNLVLQRAEQTLVNLEKCEMNIKQMAEFGRLLPLLKRLVDGDEEERLEMTSCLANLAPSDEGKAEVAAFAAKTLVEMLDSGYMAGRESALKALLQLSMLERNGIVLVEAGILPPLIRYLFLVGVNQLPMKLKEVSASLLANLVNSGVDIESLPINPEGDTLTSENIIHNFLHLISNTGPTIEAKLLQVIVALACNKSTHAIENVVSSIKSAGAAISLIQFLEAPQKELRVNSVKLLSYLCPYMGQELSESLQVTTGLLGTLVRQMEITGVSEEQAAAAGLLAKLPFSDVHLTQDMRKEGALLIVVKRIAELRLGGPRVGAARYVVAFMEGLVGVLARFTLILEDGNMLDLAREYKLADLFTGLLSSPSGSDEVQRLSALALGNLSNYSKRLSLLPQVKHDTKFLFKVLPCLQPPPEQIPLCPVHGGICSSQSTFCLLEADAVVPLVACLDSTNLATVESVLGALSTLISDQVRFENGVQVLRVAEAFPHIIVILCEHKTDTLRYRAIWIVERALRNADLARAISTDPRVHTAIVEAYRSNNQNTRQIAEAALKHLNRIPQVSGVFAQVM